MRLLEKIDVHLLWFDSMGAKSASVAIRLHGSGERYLVIDPGAAAMQPSYPLESSEKKRLRRKAVERIKGFLEKAEAVIITHYHHDHFVYPHDRDLAFPKIYCGKKLYVKNPNKYINQSQWGRSRVFLSEIVEVCGESTSLDDYLAEPMENVFEDPVEKLEHALARDYGDYAGRKKELLEKGRKWFKKLSETLWGKKKWVQEIKLPNINAEWLDNRELCFGDITVKAYPPWFHGVEYDRTGWIIPLLIRVGGYKLFYSSDLMGPIIEDYAYEVIRLKPDILILDGPPTYLFPYMFNRVNLRRAVENLVNIISCGRPKLIIYDHHLLREKNWRKWVEEAFAEARKQGVEIMTAAEYYGDEPLIDKL